MLENIELFGNSLGTGTYPDGEGKSFLQNIFDIIHPVGETYIQYPAQKSPQEIYNKKDGDRIIIDSVWEEQLQYNSAFFRSEHPNTYAYKAAGEEQYYDIDNNNNLTPIKVTGNDDITVAGSPTSGQQKIVDGKTYQAYAITGINTSSNPYIIETNGLSKQDNQNKYHNHDGNTGYTKPNVSVSGTAAEKSLTGNVYKAFASSAICDGICEQYAYEEKYSMSGSTGGWGRLYINASHGHSVSASGTADNHRHSIDYDGSSTDQESRPDNYTIKIWKRIN